MPIQIRHIQYVIAATDYGSFRRASAALGVEESAISRRIRDLESRLGAALFVRSAGGVRLTQAGTQFVQRARKAMSQIELAKTEVSALARGDSGHVRIGIFSSLASGFLSDLIMSFGQRHSAVRLTFVDGNPSEHVAAVRQHQLDIAFITGVAGWQGCRSQHMWSERIFVVLPAQHGRANETEVHLSDFADETFIVSECAPGEEIYDYLVQRLADLGRHPDIRQQSVGRDNLMRLVALGCGITVTSEATTGAQVPGIVFSPIVGEMLPFSAVWSANNDNPAFLHLLRLAQKMARSQALQCLIVPKTATVSRDAQRQNLDLSR